MSRYLGGKEKKEPGFFISSIEIGSMRTSSIDWLSVVGADGRADSISCFLMESDL